MVAVIMTLLTIPHNTYQSWDLNDAVPYLFIDDDLAKCSDLNRGESGANQFAV